MITEYIATALGIGILVCILIAAASFMGYILFLYSLWILEVIFYPLSLTLIITWHINIFAIFGILIQVCHLKKSKCFIPFFSILDLSIIIDFVLIFVIIGITIFVPESLVEPFKTEKNTAEEAKYNFWWQYGFLLFINLLMIMLPSSIATLIDKEEIRDLIFQESYYENKKLDHIV